MEFCGLLLTVTLGLSLPLDFVCNCYRLNSFDFQVKSVSSLVSCFNLKKQFIRLPFNDFKLFYVIAKVLSPG